MSEKENTRQKLDDIKQIGDSVEDIEKFPDDNDLAEGERDHIAFEASKQEILDKEQYRLLRECYGSKCFNFLVGWSVCLFVLLILCGQRCFTFHISDSVLIALVANTTVNVIGLIVIILRGVFPQ